MLNSNLTLSIIVSLIFLGQLVLAQTDPGAANRQVEKRLALVIGNGAYQKTSELPNPSNDAADMSATLSALGFEVLSGTNQTKRQMETLIREFGNKLSRQGGVGLFFYAGHGLQIKGNNYLIPVDAEIPAPDEVEYATINLSFLLGKMDAAGNDLNIVILDACRNNPFARSWRNFRDIGEGAGLAKITPPTGTIMLYATQPGNVASDGSGRNGLFTESLLEQIRKPGVELDAMIKQLARDVSERSGKKQMPWKEGIVTGDFFFAGSGGGAQPMTEAMPASGGGSSRSAEDVMWDTIARINTKFAVEGYLSEYPNGKYAATARLMIKVFEGDESRKAKEADDQKWAEAVSLNTIESYRSYLKAFPGGNHINAAIQSHNELMGKAQSESPTVSVGPRINVALASNGGVAKASSTEDGSVSARPGAFPVASVIDGDRKGSQWGNKGGWNDGTAGTYPDWVEIELRGSPTIDEIRVFTLQDKPERAVEPHEQMTFTLYGITSFEVQFWNGSGWVTVPNGKVERNNKVYNKFAFPGLATSRIRVVVYGALVDFSRIVEIEAWGTQPRSN